MNAVVKEHYEARENLNNSQVRKNTPGKAPYPQKLAGKSGPRD